MVLLEDPHLLVGKSHVEQAVLFQVTVETVLRDQMLDLAEAMRRDSQSLLALFALQVLETVDPFSVRSSGYSFLYEMVFRVSRGGFSIGEIPILFEQRVAGDSKIDSSEIYFAAWRVLMTALRPPKIPPR